MCSMYLNIKSTSNRWIYVYLNQVNGVCVQAVTIVRMLLCRVTNIVLVHAVVTLIGPMFSRNRIYLNCVKCMLVLTHVMIASVMIVISENQSFSSDRCWLISMRKTAETPCVLIIQKCLLVLNLCARQFSARSILVNSLVSKIVFRLQV